MADTALTRGEQATYSRGMKTLAAAYQTALVIEAVQVREQRGVSFAPTLQQQLMFCVRHLQKKNPNLLAKRQKRLLNSIESLEGKLIPFRSGECLESVQVIEAERIKLRRQLRYFDEDAFKVSRGAAILIACCTVYQAMRPHGDHEWS